MTQPVRLRLSRKRGFDLQALSRATNGLDAVKVTRPSIFGNPFSVLPHQKPGKQFGRCVMAGAQAFGGTIAVPTVEDAVACFRELMRLPGDRPDVVRERLTTLRGKNLACWCALPEPGKPDICHAAVLLEIANKPTCEEVK